MVTGLVDTSIVVDVVRHHPPALAWFRGQSALGITPIVWMELVAGAGNKAAQLQATRVVLRLEMIYLTQADQDWAMQQLLLYRLSHGVGVLDCLIASASHRLQAPLYTQNQKHFIPLLGALAQRPY